MQASPPLSVTQSTAISANGGAAADSVAWQSALVGASGPVQHSNTPSVTNTALPQKSGTETAPANPTQQAPAGGAASVAVAKTETPKTTKSPATSTAPTFAKDEKRDTHQAFPVAGMVVQMQPVTQMRSSSVTPRVLSETEKNTAHAQAVSADTTVHLPKAQTGVASADTSKDIAQVNPPAAPTPTPTTKPSPAAPVKIDSKPEPAVPTSKTAYVSATQPDMANAAPVARPVETQSLVRAIPTNVATPPPVSQPVVVSTVQALFTRAAQPASTITMSPAEKDKHGTQQISAVVGTNASAADFSAAVTGGSIALAQTNATDATANTATSPAALAATVTVLHQSGQASTVLRLDPPGLGHISVEVGVGAQGQVNVMFLTSSGDAAQALHASLPNLGAAMAQSGLMLGQAQVGGQFSQQGGQSEQDRQAPPRQTHTGTSLATTQSPTSGLSAYA